MKKGINKTQKILLLVIGILAVALMALIVRKAYQLYGDSVQAKEWKVRQQETQAELDDIKLQIQELSGDGEALQQFLDDKLNPAIIVEEPEPVEPEPTESEGQTGQESALEEPGSAENEGLENAETGNADKVAEAGDNAIIIDEPEPVKPAPEQPQEAISENRVPEQSQEEAISENRVPEQPQEEAISENRVPEQSQEEAISENRVPEQPQEAISENQVPQQPEEAISGNQVPQQPQEAISGNEIAVPNKEESISGNAIVNGQVIPFQKEERQPTLEERRAVRSSYEETMLVNAASREMIQKNTIDFSDKKIACLGDSLTEGSNLSNVENYEQYAYPEVLKNLLGAEEVYNLGIGGSSYGRYWDKAFVERYKEIPKDTDIILVMGGTNDGFAASSKELGSLAEKKPRTFYGDVDELMRGLIKEYPESKVIFVTPLPNVLHDYLRNERNYLLPQSMFANAIKELAAQYSIDVIDLYNSNVLDTHDAQVISNYMPDGVHGNAAGYQVLAEYLAGEIIQIMEKDALYEASVSGNTAGETTGETAVSISGNEQKEAPETEEKEELIFNAVSQNQVAEDALIIIDAPKEEPTDVPLQETLPEETGTTEETKAAETAPQEEMPEENYEYGGEAIVIQ